jgi:hypothetical protein
MTGARVNITPKRSVAFFAALAVLMVGVSYVVLLLVGSPASKQKGYATA